MTKEDLNKIVDDTTTKRGRIFDYCIQALIIISLVGFAISTLPDLSARTQSFLGWIEMVAVIVFSIEYLLRIYVADRPSKYMLSFYGIIDLLAILPFYLSTSSAFLTLRIFRVFRIFRAFKLVRYNKAFKRFKNAWVIIKEEVILFFIVTAIFLFLASAGIYFFENPVQPEKFSSIFSSAWWAIVTLTTVGYGDVFPVTTAGRIFTFFILMLGVGIVTIPAGLLSSALTKSREMEEELKESKQAEQTTNAN